MSQLEVSRPVVLELRLPSWLEPRTRRLRVAAALIILVSLLWRAIPLSQAYFVEDDLIFTGHASAEGLTWDYLTRNHIGHIMPGGFALIWVMVRIAAYNWLLTCLVILALLAVTQAALYHVLRRLFGERPAILVPLAVFCFSSLLGQSVTWWASAVNLLPLLATTLLALAKHIDYLRSGELKDGLYAAGWVALGLFCFEKALFIPPLLAAMTVLYGRQIAPEATGSWWTRVIRRPLPLWLLSLVMMAGYDVFFFAQQPAGSEANPGLPTAEVARKYTQWLIGETFGATAVGGPLSWGPINSAGAHANPPGWLVAAGWIVIGLLIVASLLKRRGSWKAWTLLFGYVVIGAMLPTLLTRARVFPIAFGHETRYLADVMPVLAICLGLAFLPLAGEVGAIKRRLPAAGVLTVVLLVVYLAFSVVSMHRFTGVLQGDRLRAYFDNARSALDSLPPGTDVYPTAVPGNMLFIWHGNGRLTSRVISPLAPTDMRESMRRPMPTLRAVVLDEKGRARPMTLYGFTHRPLPGQPCFAQAGGLIETPALTGGGPGLFGSILYETPLPVTLETTIGDEALRLAMPAGTGKVYFPIRAKADRLRFRVLTPAVRPCLHEVTIGAPIVEPGR